MAILAQVRRTALEEIGVGRAVRVMAVGTILAHRGMLPQVGAALLRVATVTGFVDRGSLEQTGAFASAMRVMASGAFIRTVTACHHGVSAMVHLRSFGLMARKANTLAHGITDSMQIMAIDTTDATQIMYTATPLRVSFAIFMANQTGLIVFCRSGATLLERLGMQRPRVIVLSHNFYMRRPAAMARLAARQSIP